jgi:FMN-dependent NADH-azoreductase
MQSLLRIDSSPLGSGQSFSRNLTGEFVRRWQSTHPDGRVVGRDLATTPLFPLTAEWIAAAYTPEASRTPAQQKLMSLSDELIAELMAADEFVIGVPMHNFSIPGHLKLWVDQVVRAGKTFSYATGAPTGLLKNKKATLILATGGVYETGTPAAGMDFVEPYLRSLLTFLGVVDVQVIRASGTSTARDTDTREAVLGSARAAIQSLVEAA